MRVLLIGFGPFPGAPFNPSAALVKALARRRRPAFAEIVCTTHVFATTYAAVDHDLPRLFALKPDIILMFGLAGRRRQLCIETRARNAVSVLFPDASGYCPQRDVIAPGGEAALPAAAPLPGCWERYAGTGSRPACRGMPDDTYATTPIGAHWSALAAAGLWFNSFIFRLSA